MNTNKALLNIRKESANCAEVEGRRVVDYLLLLSPIVNISICICSSRCQKSVRIHCPQLDFLEGGITTISIPIHASPKITYYASAPLVYKVGTNLPLKAIPVDYARR